MLGLWLVIRTDCKILKFAVFTYSKAQQPLKSFDRHLMRVSLSNSILVILIFY